MTCNPYGSLTSVLTKDFLEKEHIDLDKSATKIAKENLCSRGIVTKYLKKYNIKGKRKTPVIHGSLVDNEYGRLTVIAKGKYDGKNLSYICECNCKKENKNIIEVRSSSLLKGNTQSCGCIYKKMYYGEMSGRYWSEIRVGARKRNLSFEITKEYVWNLFLKQNRKCSLSNLDIFFPENNKEYNKHQWTASLDRIDSFKGYIIDNVQWTHKYLNRMKNDYPQSLFIDFCKRVAEKSLNDNKVFETGVFNAVF